MFDIPESLSREEKGEIEAKFEEILDEVIQSGSSYGESTDVLESCENMVVSAGWLEDWAKLATALLEMVEKRGAFKGQEVSIQAKHLAIAALVYLVEPYDAIHDFDLTRGYVDDAWVLKLAGRRIKSQFPNVYYQIEESID